MAQLPEADRTLVMGILNVTPDSFSDGGKFLGVDEAIAHGFALADSGADIVDVGGESTRPGAIRVDEDTERARVVPVIEALASHGVAVSIDTMRSGIARAAVDAGARLVNDVSGGLADPDMARVVAELDVDFVAMHWRAHSTEMDAHDDYEDVVAEVHNELLQRVFALQDAGVANERIIIDPGLGFAKVGEANWRLLSNLDVLRAGFGPRILIGASRKRFLGSAIGRDEFEMADPDIREHATTAVTTLAAQAGVWCVRVHDARAASDAVRVVSAWQNAAITPE